MTASPPRRPEINGLLLPAELAAMIDAGRWPSAEIDQTLVDRLSPENDGLHLYSLGLMQSESVGLGRDLIQTEVFLGAPDAESPPGDIDPWAAVLIADLGPGMDQPVALDYRESRDWPRVLTLRWSDRGERNRWVTVAADFAAFADLIGLSD